MEQTAMGRVEFALLGTYAHILCSPSWLSEHPYQKGLFTFCCFELDILQKELTFVSWAFPSEAAPALWKGAGSQAGAYL